MSSCLYHESLPITRVIVNTMSPEMYTNYREFFVRNVIFRSAEIQNYMNAAIKNTEITRYKLQKYRNTNYRNTNYRNTNYRNKDM